MPAGRTYVVTSPDLVQAVQRHPKAISFWWIAVIFGARLAALSEQGKKTLFHNVEGEKGDSSMFMDGLRLITRSLKPGPALDDMNREMGTSLCKVFEHMNSGTSDLWEFVKHAMTIATTDAVYGPMNPYRDPKVEAGFWDLADAAPLLLVGLLPSITARKGYLGRKIIIKAFQKYFSTEGPRAGSTMTKSRHNTTSDYAISLDDTARFEAVQGITILSNTIPTGFWTLFYVLSQDEVLRRVRKEAEKRLSVEKRDGKIVQTIDVSTVRESVLLTSIFQEALRHQAIGSGSRMVTEDTLLNHRFLLKKGAFLVMPNEPIHFNEQIWGSNVKDFNAQRFESIGSKVPAGTLRAFGGGVNLCPGRFFAMTEILCMVLLCSLKYDFVPISGKWEKPQPDQNVMSSIVLPPRDKLMVRIEARKEFESSEWRFKLDKGSEEQ